MSVFIEPVKIGNFYLDPYFLLYSFFTLGAIMRLLLRAGNAYRSQVNLYPSRWAFISRNWDIFLVRSGLSLALFSIWIFHPGIASKGLLLIGIAAGVANWITIPPTLGTSWLAGIFGDWGLDQVQIRIAYKFPKASRYIIGEVPSYDSSVVDVESLGRGEEEK